MNDHPGFRPLNLTRARGLEAAPVLARWSSMLHGAPQSRTRQEPARRNRVPPQDPGDVARPRLSSAQKR
jgi:hypothetical protein